MFFFFSGSVFQRELQVFARARGGFRRAAAAGACFFFFLFFADAERDERTTNLIFEPTPLLWGSLLSLSLWLSRVFLFKTDSFSLSLSLSSTDIAAHMQRLPKREMFQIQVRRKAFLQFHHRGEREGPKIPSTPKKKIRIVGAIFFLRSGTRAVFFCIQPPRPR